MALSGNERSAEPAKMRRLDRAYAARLANFMRQSRKVCQRGVQLCNSDKVFFPVHILVDEGREDPNTSESGSSSACQQNAILWRFAGVPMMAQH